MKNKHIIILSLSACMLVLSLSCSKVLDRKPEDSISDLNYWQNADELKLFCNNFYQELYVPDMNADNQSDNMVPNSPDPWLYGLTTVPSSGGGWAFEDWKYIRDANYFLTHYQTATGTEEQINEYVGEIRFFRAYEYFNKVKTFGDVPWINKDLNIDDDEFLYKPRTDRRVVVDSIIADLQFAFNHLPTADKVEVGRLHKYAAEQMLARVCLYEGTWMKYRNISGWETYLELASSSAKDMMDNGGYSIYKPAAQYYYQQGDQVDAKTHTLAGRDYPLSYKAQFIQEDLTSNPECVLPKIYRLNQLTNNISRSVGQPNAGVSKDLIDAFLCADGKPIALSTLYKGDDSAIMEIQNRDPRMRNEIDNRYLPNYLNGSALTSNYLTNVNSSIPTGYLASKFRSPVPQQNEANQTTFDMYVFRYAEVLLIYAEAKAELGDITQGDLDISINKLRERLDEPDLPEGKMARLTMNPPADPNAIVNGQPRYGYQVSPLIYEIRRERRVELAFEGFRWDDIVRWKAGKLLENPKTVYGIVASDAVQNEYNDYFGSDIFQGTNIVTYKDWNGTKKFVAPYATSMRKWNDKLYLKPIPRDQIVLSNGQIKQNPGWE